MQPSFVLPISFNLIAVRSIINISNAYRAIFSSHVESEENVALKIAISQRVAFFHEYWGPIHHWLE